MCSLFPVPVGGDLGSASPGPGARELSWGFSQPSCQPGYGLICTPMGEPCSQAPTCGRRQTKRSGAIGGRPHFAGCGRRPPTRLLALRTSPSGSSRQGSCFPQSESQVTGQRVLGQFPSRATQGAICSWRACVTGSDLTEDHARRRVF